MKLSRNHLIFFLLLTIVLSVIITPILAQDDVTPEATAEPTPEPTIVPYGTDTAPDWLIFLTWLGGGINSFAGGASFMAVLLLLVGRFSENKRMIGLLESSTQGLRDSWPPETRQLLMNIGTGVRNIGAVVEEVFDEVPVGDKP